MYYIFFALLIICFKPSYGAAWQLKKNRSHSMTNIFPQTFKYKDEYLNFTVKNFYIDQIHEYATSDNLTLGAKLAYQNYNIKQNWQYQNLFQTINYKQKSFLTEFYFRYPLNEGSYVVSIQPLIAPFKKEAELRLLLGHSYLNYSKYINLEFAYRYNKSNRSDELKFEYSRGNQINNRWQWLEQVFVNYDIKPAANSRLINEIEQNLTNALTENNKFGLLNANYNKDIMNQVLNLYNLKIYNALKLAYKFSLIYQYSTNLFVQPALVINKIYRGQKPSYNLMCSVWLKY